MPWPVIKSTHATSESTHAMTNESTHAMANESTHGFEGVNRGISTLESNVSKVHCVTEPTLFLV